MGGDFIPPYSLVLPAAFASFHLALAICARRLRTVTLIFRLGLAASFAVLVLRCFAHLARWAIAILALADALIFRLFFGSELEPGFIEAPKI